MSRILAVASDPGGANALLPVVEALREMHTVTAVLTGPAREIFKKKDIPFIDAEALDALARNEAFAKADPELVITGTGTDVLAISKQSILYAREQGIPSLSVLDFWSNYWQRFSGSEKDFKYMPSMICVLDETAKQEMFAEGFPPEAIAVTGNPHFEHFTDGIARESEDASRALFISQPIKEVMATPGYAPRDFDEFSVLADITHALPPSMTLALRLHPKEAAGKYDAYLNEQVVMSIEPVLENDLSRAGLIVGVYSPVLMQAALAGKNVVSYEPVVIDPDPLVSNRLGITKLVGNCDELASFFAAYARGENPGILPGAPDFPRAGATARVLSEVAKLLARPSPAK